MTRLAWFALSLGVVLVGLFQRASGPLPYAAAVLFVGVILFLTPLERLRSYWLFVPACMAVIGGGLLVLTLQLLATRWREPWVFLWALVFPVGLGLGLYTWASLQPSSNRLAGGRLVSTASVTIRYGLMLFWALFAWYYLLQNGNSSTEREVRWLAAFGIPLFFAIVLLFWHGGPDAARGLGLRYVQLLGYLLRLRRRGVAQQFHSRAIERWGRQLEVWKFQDEPGERVQRIALLPTDMLELPAGADRPLSLALQQIADADKTCCNAARAAAWRPDKWLAAVNDLDHKIQFLEARLGLGVVVGRAAIQPSNQPHYEFTPSDRIARTIAQLLATCNVYRPLARIHLERGFFESWLETMNRKDLSEEASRHRADLKQFLNVARRRELQRNAASVGQSIKTPVGRAREAFGRVWSFLNSMCKRIWRWPMRTH